MSTPPTRQRLSAPTIPSAAEQLLQELALFSDQVEAFLDASTIQYCPEDPDSIVIHAWHDYRWVRWTIPGNGCNGNFWRPGGR